MNDLVPRQDTSLVTQVETTQEFVTIRLDSQLLGIPVLAVHDVLNQQQITAVPKAQEWVSGVLNLRGRIVTAIDLRTRMGIPAREEGEKSMSVVVEHKEEPYSLQIDSVGDVMALKTSDFEKNPVTLDQQWRSVSKGIFRLDKELLVILDVEKLLDFEQQTKAA